MPITLKIQKTNSPIALMLLAPSTTSLFCSVSAFTPFKRVCVFDITNMVRTINTIAKATINNVMLLNIYKFEYFTLVYKKECSTKMFKNLNIVVNTFF